MTVYVDDGRWPLGRMLMAHMAADPHAELEAMARTLELRPEWLQHGGTWREHYDICQAKRRQAIERGAVAVGRREMIRILRRNRPPVSTL